MNKSVYSLVLMDNVVGEVDKLAYEMGTSRSNLINQILAEYVRYTTPEMRMHAIFEEMERLMQGVESFQVQPQPSDAMLTIRSALRYKYKPTIRYSVELYRTREKTVGALKVSFRTQSQPLIEMLTAFFELWAKLEHHYRSQLGLDECEYAIELGRFIRKFTPQTDEELTDRQLADGMSEYIRMFDAAIKAYFACSGDEQTALPQMESIYRNYLKSATLLL
ncbi:MAG: hypothetical protein SPE01_12005 [Candidatus Spyradocola sp.]|nr:hypothetical protein [Candidatus Spyradocola sp.]